MKDNIADLPPLRPYRGPEDLPGLYHVLRRGLLAHGPQHYVHPGDLNWWLFYPPLEGGSLLEQLYLWDNPERAGELLGWALFSPDGWNTFDVFVQPEYYASPQLAALSTWAEAGLLERLQAQGEPAALHCMWVSPQDDFRRAWLAERGYQPSGLNVHFTYNLSDPPPAPQLPPGFELRPVAQLDEPAGLVESAQRAAAQKASFGTEADWDAYLGRYRNLMRQPAYQRALDLAIFAPDGQAAAFCLLWLDAESRTGNFEPVGVHPDFQRRGLGKALLHGALRRLAELGYAAAFVGTNAEETPAVALYQAAGFHLERELAVYEKKI